MRSGKKPPEDASVAREVASAMFVSFMLGLCIRLGWKMNVVEDPLLPSALARKLS